jgi:hypothetical protein
MKGCSDFSINDWSIEKRILLTFIVCILSSWPIVYSLMDILAIMHSKNMFDLLNDKLIPYEFIDAVHFKLTILVFINILIPLFIIIRGPRDT